MAKEVLNMANDVANEHATKRRLQSENRVVELYRQRETKKLVDAVDDFNSKMDWENGGEFDCTHYTFDETGLLQVPKVRR